MANEVIVDVKELEEKAQAFAYRMFGHDTDRRDRCAQEFFREEYLKMTTPPHSSMLERVEGLLIEIRNLLKSH